MQSWKLYFSILHFLISQISVGGSMLMNLGFLIKIFIQWFEFWNSQAQTSLIFLFVDKILAELKKIINYIIQC